MSTVRTAPCTVVKVLAGDLLLLELRLGWHVVVTQPCRIAGILAMDPGSDEGARQLQQMRLAIASLGQTPGPIELTFTSYELQKSGHHDTAVGQLFVTDAQGGRHDLATAVTAGDG